MTTRSSEPILAAERSDFRAAKQAAASGATKRPSLDPTSRATRIISSSSTAFSGFERTDDWRTTGGLYREHARAFSANPAERLHFTKRFPHSDEPGSAAGGIKNYIR